MRRLTYSVLLTLVACSPLPAAQTPPASPPAGGAPQAATQTQQTTVAPPATGTPKPTSSARREYVLGPEDTIKIEFIGIGPGDRDMNKNYPVQANGTIDLKHLGTVKVEGMTLLKVADELRRLIEERVLYNPGAVRPSVEMATYRDFEVQVMGAVKNPGNHRLSGENNSVSRAINEAGGYAANAGYEVEITRASRPGEPPMIQTVTTDQLAQNDDPGLGENDKVFVKLGYVFYVNGEVNNKGEKQWKPGMTVATALVLSNGQTDKFSLGRSHISRPVKDKNGKILRYDKIKDLKLETPILPDDTLNAGKKLML
jgi:protein involved in polysaccharide export with SLBB domain